MVDFTRCTNMNIAGQFMLCYAQVLELPALMIKKLGS